ncbi:hypothetical protein Trydic_g12573 [Trypoxylus dichotomus]
MQQVKSTHHTVNTNILRLIKEQESETEGYIIAVQDDVFYSFRCRACRTHEETVMHLLSACPRYASTLYTDRHNMALQVLYYHLRHQYKIDEESIQVVDPEGVITNDRCNMYWNFSFSTTTQLPHNKPNLVILDSLEKKMYVI